MRRRVVSFVSVAAMALALVLVTEVTTEGRPACSNATLHGQYSLRASGEVIGVGPLAIVGVFRFDGNGHVTASVTTRLNGVNTHADLQGVYSVNAACVVEDSLTASNGSVSTHESVIFDSGDGYFVLNTTAGAPNMVIGEACHRAGSEINSYFDAGAAVVVVLSDAISFATT